MTTNQTKLNDRLSAVRERINSACRRAGRDPTGVTLIGVSKTWPLADLQAAAAAGLSELGESYAREAVDKIRHWSGPRPVWHFIGPLQSNKTRAVAEHFDWVHSVDRLKIARRLSEQRPEALTDLRVCIQVNISADPAKSGVAPSEVAELARRVDELPRLAVCGIMAIPAAGLAETELRRQFSELKRLGDRLGQQLPACRAVSMGMSADFETAIECGATQVRVGSAIFGARDHGGAAPV